MSLLGALGATVSERAGSRVAVKLNDRVAVFHRPHPRPEMGRAAVRALRRFLESAGVEP
ncbi:MAG: type II toxin-antitoxin system HicA family toxin [Gemmatimonadota bacterium]